MIRFLSFFILTISLYSNDIVVEEDNLNKKPFSLTLQEVSSLDKGLKRDFFINEYLQQNISSQEAFKTLSLIDNMNNEIFFNFSKKFDHEETKAVALCMNMKKEDLVYSYADCIVSGLVLDEISTLSAIELDLILQKTKEKYPTFHKKVKILSSSIPFTKLIIQKKDLFYEIYMGVDEKFRTRYFNYKLPKRTFAKIFEDKDSFDKFLALSLRNSKLDKLNKSLLKIDDLELNFNSSFLLALNALRYKDLNKAFEYFNNALKKAENSIKNKNRVNFWLYVISKDEKYINNIIEDGFYKQILLENTNKKQKFRKQNLESFKSFKKNKAFLQAISKVKSNFKEDYISKDFDIGLSQINIKKAKEIANINTLNYKLDELFQVEKNLQIADLYLEFLKEKNSQVPNILFSYNDKEDLIKTLKNKSFLDTLDEDLKTYFNIEMTLFAEDEYLKDLLYEYVYYFNSEVKKTKNRVLLTTILKSLTAPDQTLSK